jgi:hypothetical protein
MKPPRASTEYLLSRKPLKSRMSLRRLLGFAMGLAEEMRSAIA